MMIDPFIREVGGWVASQLEACTRCGVCADVCPFYQTTRNPEYAPIWKLELLRRAWEQRYTLAGRVKVGLRLEKPIGEEDLQHWQELNFTACSTCNRCSVTCPMGIAVGLLLHEVRDRLAAAGALPDNLLKVQQTVQREGNVFGYPAYERAGWVDYMDDPPDDLYQRPQAKVVYFVGCVSSFSPRAQRIAEAMVRLLTAAQVDFTILGEGEACCGFPLRSAGLLDRASELVQRNVEAFQATGADTVVFTCPACRLMWLEEYARHLPQARMLHATQYLAELIRQGRIVAGEISTTVTYHDPCDLTRTGGVYDAPRSVLQAVPGLKLLEVAERRTSGLCCGGGGDVEMVAPQNVKGVARETAAKLSEPGAALLATACPQCMRVLEEGMKSVNPQMRVLDVVEILAQAAGLNA